MPHLMMLFWTHAESFYSLYLCNLQQVVKPYNYSSSSRDHSNSFHFYQLRNVISCFPLLLGYSACLSREILVKCEKAQISAYQDMSLNSSTWFFLILSFKLKIEISSHSFSISLHTKSKNSNSLGLRKTMKSFGPYLSPILSALLHLHHFSFGLSFLKVLFNSTMETLRENNRSNCMNLNMSLNFSNAAVIPN